MLVFSWPKEGRVETASRRASHWKQPFLFDILFLCDLLVADSRLNLFSLTNIYKFCLFRAVKALPNMDLGSYNVSPFNLLRHL